MRPIEIWDPALRPFGRRKLLVSGDAVRPLDARESRPGEEAVPFPPAPEPARIDSSADPGPLVPQRDPQPDDAVPEYLALIGALCSLVAVVLLAWAFDLVAWIARLIWGA